MNTRFSYTPRILLLQIQTFQREWNNGRKIKPSQPPVTITIVDKKYFHGMNISTVKLNACDNIDLWYPLGAYYKDVNLL